MLRIPNRVLRDLRARKGWSQEQVARRARVALGTVNAAETGKQVPTVMTQEKIARVLGVARQEIWPEGQQEARLPENPKVIPGDRRRRKDRSIPEKEAV